MARVRFQLVAWADGELRKVSLSDDEFAALSSATRSLARVLGIEEKFDMLAENYDELEAALTTVGRRRAMFAVQPNEAISDIHFINRRLGNFMSTARMYIDQTDHDLCTIFGKESPERTGFDAVRGNQYDQWLGYRVFEALRNYTQHRDIPVHQVAHRMHGEKHERGHLIVHRSVASIDLARVHQEGGFKKSVLRELEAVGPEIDIKPLLREYVTGLYAVHTSLRGIIHDREQLWRVEVKRSRRRVEMLMANEDATIYHVEGVTENGDSVMSEAFDSFLPRLDLLRRKNRPVRDLTMQLRQD